MRDNQRLAQHSDRQAVKAGFHRPLLNPQLENRWLRLWKSVWKDFKGVLPYLLGGIAIGSFIYGFLPTKLIAENAGSDDLFAIPVAAVIGIRFYIRVEAVIPLSAALAAKGM
ncbi:MAG: permease [Leisingera sp.]